MGGKVRRLFGLILLAALIAGCWDRRELESSAQVVSIGLDQGEAGRITVTARVGPVAGAGADPRTAPGVRGIAAEIMSTDAQTLSEALYILNGGMSRRLDFRHLRSVVFGEALARSGLEPLVMELLRSAEVRETILFIQARGQASEVLLANRPPGESDPAKMVEDFILQDKQLHQAPPIRLQQWLIRMAAAGGDPIATATGVNRGVAGDIQAPPVRRFSALPGEMPRRGGNPVEQVGTAIYRRDKLVGFLTVDETQMLLALRGEMGKAYISFPDPYQPGRQVSMRFHQENLPRLQPLMQGTVPHVRESLLFEGELLAAPSGTDYVHEAARARLEQAAAAYAERTVAGVLKKLKAWKTDPVGYGHLFRSRFKSFDEWQAYDWRRHVGDLQVTVNVDMRVRRYALRTGADRVGPEE